EQTLILIKGARGAGKTTLLLQRFAQQNEKAIYLSLDDFYFETNRLLLLIEDLYTEGYTTFFLDEVHQYPHWSRDFKNIYDNFPEIKIVATGSSALQIDKGIADLSRRMTVYKLHGLSFREFIEFERGIYIPPISLKYLLEKHEKYSVLLNDLFNPLGYFEDYLKYGYYPFYQTDRKFYHQKLQQTVQLTIDVDLPSVENLNFSSLRGMKKLLFILTQIVPYTPNIQSLAKKMGTPRNFVLRALDLLDRSDILSLLRSETKGISYLQKPEKIYLNNPNLFFVFNDKSHNKGNLRETFFFNQLKVKHEITASKFGDFLVDQSFIFEVGGATKTNKQIAGIPTAYIAADDIKFGSKNKIPLYLFGFLY
ncbi:MAG: ATP-binding protein, partial [Bacteroidales bacterium]|nr:ATP-binding protein [Bacteroidales bacterium]